MKLYHFPASTNSRKVRILLIEKGLEFERIYVDLTKKEQKKPEYLKINPFGQVPALDDDGFIVYDSTIINEYLEDEYPHPPLLPNDSDGRARARLMEDFRDIHFTPHFVEIIREIRKPEAERDQKVIQNAKGIITQCFDRIERELEGRDYLAGTFSLADISYMPNIALLERLEIPVDPKYKNMRAWIGRLKARPSFAESVK
ncbi:MAG: glutathione S-transferase family protein [Deltaproteobacteria bacterium]|nr:glutathione S-transferase family protein [Deltaproteobacteria bacterium]